jgi:alkylation response protein AidB-like acyl-CoA dehydrogenase
MDFSLSEDQEMLKTTARNLLEKECTEAVLRETIRRKEGYYPDLWKKMADLGWMGVIFPEKYGGTNGGIIDAALLFEEMGRVICVSPFLSTVVLCGMTILNAGSDEQKERFLPRIVKGELILALAMTEPEGTWNHRAWEPEGIMVSAELDGGDYIINGTKLFVHDAHVADYLLVVTRTKQGKKVVDGITLFIVDARSAGISCEMLKTLSGAHKQSAITFKNVRVPKENIVGRLHKGWEPLSKILKIGTVMLCAEMVGAGQKILEMTTDYAKTRIQFEMPIGINQHVQEHCVQMLALVDTSRYVTYQSAWLLSEDKDCDLEVAIAKAWTSEGNEKICWYAHQVFAGVGSTEALGVMPIYTRLGNVAQYYLGSAEYYMNKIADELEKLSEPDKSLGKPLGLWKADKQGFPSWDIWREYYQKNM